MDGKWGNDKIVNIIRDSKKTIIAGNEKIPIADSEKTIIANSEKITIAVIVIHNEDYSNSCHSYYSSLL
jgi:hypothetical protein